MNPIETIFGLHDEAVSRNYPAAKFRFGSLWEPEDGIILYPPNGNARDYINLLRLTVPEIPLVLCDEPEAEMTMVSGLQACGIDEATKLLPRALFVLCATGDLATGFFACVARFLSPDHINNMINFRQLGEFLPAGDRKSRAFDVYRKSFLAASPRNRQKVEAAFALFTDTLSQAVFCAVLKRYLLSSDSLIPVSSSREYFEDVYTRSPDEIFVDCGAYSGDTLRDFLEIGGNIAEYHAFEPDPRNFEQLSSYVKTLPNALRARCRLHPCAVGHERATVQFDAGATMGSMVNPEGALSVESMTLDEALSGVAPTLIKFDIEGYEAFALQGGRALIQSARPVLALCVYHHSFDLWEIPLMVKSMVSDYRFFLRAYQEQFSYTCYCVPPERLHPEWR